VSALGFGAAAIGNLYRALQDDVASDAVIAALDAGIRYFDTAPHYGFGLSEERLGGALGNASSGATVTVSTKVGRVLRPLEATETVGTRHGFADARPYEPVFDYSYDGVLSSFDSSLSRLGLERVGIVYVHDLGRATHGDAHPEKFREFFEGGYRALESLKSEGRIDAIGIGANEWQICEQALEHGDFDGFLLAGRYTLLEQSALDTFLPICARLGCSVVLGGPFNSGILARGFGDKGPTTHNYAPASPAIIDRVERIQSICEDHGVPLKAAALQFGRHHPQVVSTIPGLADIAQVHDAIGMMSLPIPAALWAELKHVGLLHAEAPTSGEDQA
jgi:D-threo-aldose 1-dehydrogenase